MSNKRVFLVKEDDLLDLLICRLKLDCLNRDGVDNWPWYMESENEIIAEFLHVENPEDFTFEDCAKKELKDFLSSTPCSKDEDEEMVLMLAEDNIRFIVGSCMPWQCSDNRCYKERSSAIAHEITLYKRKDS